MQFEKAFEKLTEASNELNQLSLLLKEFSTKDETKYLRLSEIHKEMHIESEKFQKQSFSQKKKAQGIMDLIEAMCSAETETKEILDAFADALIQILEEAKTNPSLLKDAPLTTPVRRLDDVKAARELNLVYHQE